MRQTALLSYLFVAGSTAASLFDCPSVTVPPMPTNISNLHPGHVSIVMAAGDSITAAFSARSDFYEARDISWAMGVGSADQLTLPWLLGQYSTKVEGMSTKKKIPTGIFHLPHGDYHEGTDNLNAAESEGAVSRNSLVEQWAILSSHMTKYQDFDDRWKVLTIWMTANDVCEECNGPWPPAKLAAWVAGTEQFITNMTTATKRVYINLISTLELSRIAELQSEKEYCKVLHKDLIDECTCVDRGNSSQLAQLDVNTRRNNAELHKIAQKFQERFKSEGRSDVAVVVQPFQEGLGATIDHAFLSKLDCFHPSADAHQSLAIGVWNSMLCTGDRAKRCGDLFSQNMKPVCPDATSLFYTGDDVVPVVPPAERMYSDA